MTTMTESQIEYKNMLQSENERTKMFNKQRQIETDNLRRERNEKHLSGSMDEFLIEKKDITNACSYGRLDVVKKLCEDESFVKSGSGFGSNAVWNAACCGRLNVVQFLLTIPFISENLDYKYMIKEARAYGHPETSEYLESKQ
jgi:hypothetical protein